VKQVEAQKTEEVSQIKGKEEEVKQVEVQKTEIKPQAIAPE
jgi:hypothetical protein